MILGLSSCFQLDGAPESASIFAWVGTWLYLFFGSSSALICCEILALCSLAAFFDIFSQEKMDILLVVGKTWRNWKKLTQMDCRGIIRKRRGAVGSSAGIPAQRLRKTGSLG